MTARAERFPLMDSLRAIAALSILVYHAGYFGGLQRTDFVGHNYAASLDVGVAIFFLVSGFLLYRPFVRARLAREPMPEVAAYAWRRFLRIVPAFWVALTLVTVVLSLPGVFTWTGIPTYYGFAQIYSSHNAFGGIAQAWTLCIEVSFYAFLPFWALGMRKLRGGATPRARMRQELIALFLLACASVLVKAVALKIADVHSGAPQVPLMPLWNFLDQFAVGMGMAVLSVWFAEHTDAWPRPMRLLDRYPSIAWGVALVAFVLVSALIPHTGFGTWVSPRDFLIRHELYLVIAAGLLLPAVFGDPARGVVRRILGNRLLLYCGLVSYGLYLYQLGVLQLLLRWDFNSVAKATVPWLAWLLACFAFTLLVATASYYLVERPALRLKNRVGARRPVPADEAIAEPAPVLAPAGPSR
jgi:peptidoglycan/LPS O-acetylase OafA/YrhL